jgi:hypothetical protein
MGLNENNRIFWAIKAFGMGEDGATSFTEVHGLQSVGITTTFNLEQLFEIGQVSIYENIEDIPDVEVTTEKVLDGYPLVYHLATPNTTVGSLLGRTVDKCIGVMSIFGDVQDSASGTPNSQVTMSGLFVNNLSYNIPVEGQATESVTLIGNDKVWSTSSFTFSGSIFDNTDSPLAALGGSGGIQRREDVLFDSLTDGTVSLMPTDIPGITSSGTNEAHSNGVGLAARIQNISVSADLGRESLFELGKKSPFFRSAASSVEVTTEIETLAFDGDLVGATEAGVASGGNNLTDQQIIVVMRDSTKLNMGTQNKLASVTYGGADAGAGNATITYTYTTFNDLTVTHGNDPAGISG